MNKLISVGFFIAGAAVGSIITWQFLKTKYEEIAQEEIDSVKQTYAKREEKRQFVESKKSSETTGDMTYEKDEVIRKEAVKEVNRIIEDNNYTSEINEVTRDQHYIIRPDEFGEYDDYDTISLTYYADHILTDEDDEIVEDIEDKIGFDALNHFGEYEEDSVFVRNDRIKCDYEILLDQRKYSEVEHYNEYQMEDE